MKYWISWYQVTDDHRPLTYPPNPQILGWWCTGYRCSDGASTLVAAVEAPDEEQAKAAVKKDWPEAEEWRFCEGRPQGWRLNDRFPLSSWMEERMGLKG